MTTTIQSRSDLPDIATNNGDVGISISSLTSLRLEELEDLIDTHTAAETEALYQVYGRSAFTSLDEYRRRRIS